MSVSPFKIFALTVFRAVRKDDMLLRTPPFTLRRAAALNNASFLKHLHLALVQVLARCLVRCRQVWCY